MQVDKAAFFLALSTLAAGGAGGYLAAKNGVFERPPSPGAAERQAVLPSASGEALASHPRAACDDMVGTPAACPPPGYPADEGGCEALPTRRCDGFKQTMKPRVAEQAVACLDALTPAQRCDTNRLNACGHVALMSACAPDEAAAAGMSTSDALESRCAAIVQTCAATPMAPSMRDCQATLSGMTAVGRDRMSTCMASHCADKGLIGCESAVQSER
jgi:hypothetical protein